MKTESRRALARSLIQRYGQTFAEEIGIPVEKNTPAPLFQLLFSSLLFSARISSGNALQAARALIDAGLTTPRKMAQATWQERVDVITWHGYKRYDERTSTMLGQTAGMLLEEYGGDLRRLREEAEYDLQQERELLMEFKGIGKVGADIFLREVQAAWTEVHPYADAKVLKAARQLGLGGAPEQLAELVPKKKFAKLVAALVRVDLAGAYREVKRAA